MPGNFASPGAPLRETGLKPALSFLLTVKKRSLFSCRFTKLCKPHSGTDPKYEMQRWREAEIFQENLPAEMTASTRKKNGYTSGLRFKPGTS